MPPVKKTTPKSKTTASPANPPPQVVLLAVTGMTPAVLTETVWALAREKPRVLPHRIVVVTTRKGRERLEEELFSPVAPGTPGLWKILREQILGAALKDSPLLTLDTIREITAPNPATGRCEVLEDFRTSAENEAMADFLLDTVRGFAENPDVHLITSIAGGRKTLGALLYACMSLLGRETDRLTHVLVTEPFDHPSVKPRFYFPEQPTQILNLPDGKTVTARHARIDLGDIPFVPLRNLFERDKSIRKPCSFTELVRRCRRRVNEVASRDVSLTVKRSRREFEVNGLRVQTSNTQQTLMLFLADPATATERQEIEKFSSAVQPLRAYANALVKECAATDGADWRDQANIPNGFNEESLRKLLNEIRGKLRAAGDEAAALIPRLPTKGRFSLDLPPTAIAVCD